MKHARVDEKWDTELWLERQLRRPRLTSKDTIKTEV
jgi:hypothetical protein